MSGTIFIYCNPVFGSGFPDEEAPQKAALPSVGFAAAFRRKLVQKPEQAIISVLHLIPVRRRSTLRLIFEKVICGPDGPNAMDFGSMQEKVEEMSHDSLIRLSASRAEGSFPPDASSLTRADRRRNVYANKSNKISTEVPRIQPLEITVP